MRHFNRVTHKYETRKELNNELYSYYSYWDYYDDGIGDFRYDDLYGVHYEYLNGSDQEISYNRGFFRAGRAVISYRYIRSNASLKIDMMSIYSKEMIRQKKVDMILGDIQDLTYYSEYSFEGDSSLVFGYIL